MFEGQIPLHLRVLCLTVAVSHYHAHVRMHEVG